MVFEHFDVSKQAYNDMCDSQRFCDIEYDFAFDRIARTVVFQRIIKFDIVVSYVATFRGEERGEAMCNGSTGTTAEGCSRGGIDIRGTHSLNDIIPWGRPNGCVASNKRMD